MTRLLFIACFLLLIVAGIVTAAEPKQGAQPISIKSDELLSDTKNRTATFTGNVIARQGDIVIYSDKLVVRYGENGNGLDRVETSGNVRIVQGTRVGTSAEAVYFGGERKIILSGNPKIHQGSDTVSGKVITYYLDEQKSVVSGGTDSRVEAVIHPGDKKSGVVKP